MSATKALIACVLAWFAASAARADHDGAPGLDGWQVELLFDRETDQFLCSANAANDSGQSFQAVLTQDGGLSVYVQDPRWFFGPFERAVNLHIRLADRSWSTSGSAKGQEVASYLGGAAVGAEILEGLASASSIDILNDRDTVVASFPQSNGAGLADHLELCLDQLREENPMEGVTNPF